MSFVPNTDTGAQTFAGAPTFAKPDVLLRVPVGLASPLWGLFAGAAMSGAAWWWMTRWAQPENLEAMFGAALKTQPAVEPEAPALAAPVAEPVMEAAPEPEPTPKPVLEVVAEAAPEPVLEALVEAPAAPLAVGGEAAPISPVLEILAPEVADDPAFATPKPKKPAAPRPV
ncbi:MAG: hypothetical protein JWR47_154 [Phenylobacterium sp.]|nr:hypothetical protein [Phenylobacterium sp.]